jgi:phosphoadenosine phosphosulfate reductase
LSTGNPEFPAVPPEPTDEQLAAKNAELESADAEAIVRWAISSFPDQVFLTTAWQRNGMVLLDMVHRLAPETPVLFIDTGYHFPETLSYALEMTARYRPNLVICKPKVPRPAFEAEHGPRLHDRDPETCCAINKVEPLDREIARLGRKVWLSGLRRDQSETRKAVPVLERRKDGIIKVSPLLRWTSRDVWNYMRQNGIPEHPLYDRGYASIGCSPESCTRPVAPGEDERAGRWAGTGKKECGIHYQI